MGGGATVSASGTIPTGSSQIAVHEIGSLTAGGTVQVGLGGKLLSVTSINSRTLITINNGTGASIPVSAGTRLLLVSDPVTVYADAAGSSAVSDVNSIGTAAGSPAAIWVPRASFDRIGVAGGDVTFNAISSATLSSTGTTLSWSHSAGGSNRLVMVAIAWQETLGEEGLESVTYDGVAMTLLTESPYSAVFSLVNPPTGSKTIVATWSGSNSKGAVGGAVSFTNVDQSNPLENPSIAAGSSTTPSVAVTSLPGLIFGHVAVNSGGSSVTVTPGSGLTQRWNAEAGSSGAATLTQGAGSTGMPNGATTSIGWTLSASRQWSAVSVIIRPRLTVLTIDEPGSHVPSTAWIDGRNFVDLQAAVDAVPPGGTLHIPNGGYGVPSGGLVIRKSMTIQGELGTRLFSYAAASDQPVIRISPGGNPLAGVTLRNLTLQNETRPASPIAGNYGLLCDVPTDGSSVAFLTLERVHVQGMGDDGIRLTAHALNNSYFVSITMRNCRSFQNWGRGLFVSTANLFEVYGSAFTSNDLDGFRGVDSQVEFHSTGFDDNWLTSDVERLPEELNGQLSLKNCPLSVVMGCHFENFTAPTHPLCRRALVIEGGGCATIMSNRFVGVGVADGSPPEDDSDLVRGIYITGGASGAVTPCTVLANTFVQVRTAIEIDGGDGLAKDCIVGPQRIEYGTGAVKLPTAVSDSGIAVLGNRKLGTGGLARGIFLPPRVNVIGGATPDPLPDLTGDDAGYVLFDTTNKRLVLWDGADWRQVSVV